MDFPGRIKRIGQVRLSYEDWQAIDQRRYSERRSWQELGYSLWMQYARGESAPPRSVRSEPDHPLLRRLQRRILAGDEHTMRAVDAILRLSELYASHGLFDTIPSGRQVDDDTPGGPDTLSGVVEEARRYIELEDEDERAVDSGPAPRSDRGAGPAERAPGQPTRRRPA